MAALFISILKTSANNANVANNVEIKFVRCKCVPELKCKSKN